MKHLETDSPGAFANGSRENPPNSGPLPVADNTPHLGPVGKALMALAKHPVSLELTAGAVLLVVCGLILFGMSLRRV